MFSPRSCSARSLHIPRETMAPAQSFFKETDPKASEPVTAGPFLGTEESGDQHVGKAPTAATTHMGLSCLRPLRIDYVFLRDFSIPILAQLINIAMHVVKTPSIGWEAAYRRGFTPKLLAVDRRYAGFAIGRAAGVVCLVR